MKNAQDKPPVVVIRRKKAVGGEAQPISGKEISLVPPKIPQELAGLERAMTLMGNRRNGDLQPQTRQELEVLIGAYPSVEEAFAWKQEFRRLRKERFDPGAAQSLQEPQPTRPLERVEKKDSEQGERRRDRSRKFPGPPPPVLTPEQTAWVEAHWEGVCQHESGLFPGSLLARLAVEQGIGLSADEVKHVAISRLAPLGAEVMKTHKEAAKQALIIWFAQDKRMQASVIAQEVGLTTLQTHGLLCRFGARMYPSEWLEEGVKAKRREMEPKLVSLLYRVDSTQESKAMGIPGKLEFTVKINQFPEEVENVVDGYKRFRIVCGEHEVMISLAPKVFKNLEQANANYPKWVAAISGQMGPATEKGFVLLEPKVQVFERKAKEKQVSTEPGNASDVNPMGK